MILVPVSIAIFYKTKKDSTLEVWTQVREDDGVFHGLLEFPGGGIEPSETPLNTVVREIEEEVGICVRPDDAKLMGIYSHSIPGKEILLNVFLFPYYQELENKGHLLEINHSTLSSPFMGKIPGPNHQIIDELYHSLFTGLK